MLRNLDGEDVDMMLESTFSIILQQFNTFDPATQSRAADSLCYLLQERSELVRRKIASLPSLASCHALAAIDEAFDRLRSPVEVGDAFQTFTSRVNHENSSVVAQALFELKDYLRLHQSFLQASAISEQPDSIIGLLTRSILDACLKFNESHPDIAQSSAECIGLIGCLDSNRVDCVRGQREMVIVNNFNEPKETTDFVIFMLEENIVPAFLSATDTRDQGFLSFVMQELLDKCDFRKICGPIVRKGERNDANPVYRRWRTFRESTQNLLTPFLTSTYSLTDMKITKVEYPIFRPNAPRFDKVYNNWLRAFVLDLLMKPYNANASHIYVCLHRAIRIKDISVASFLLPYVVQHVVVDGTDEDRLQVGQELLAVLKYEVTSSSHIKGDELKSLREVSVTGMSS